MSQERRYTQKNAQGTSGNNLEYGVDGWMLDWPATIDTKHSFLDVIDLGAIRFYEQQRHHFRKCDLVLPCCLPERCGEFVEQRLFATWILRLELVVHLALAGDVV